jgi:hypothetical protein
MFNLWVDGFSRGGLEKSIFYIANELAMYYPNTNINLHTLDTSIQYINGFATKKQVTLIYHRSRLHAYIHFLTNLRQGDILISFKNHIPLVLLFKFFRIEKSLWIRHSNTLVAQLRHRIAYSNQISYPYLLLYIDFFLRCFIYSLCPNHFANSLENSMLIETFTTQRCYTVYTYTPFLQKNNSRTYKHPKTLRIFWSGRVCNSKGIPIFLKFIHDINDRQSNRYVQIDSSIAVDVFTNDCKKFSALMLKEFPNLLHCINIKSWSNNIDKSDYDLIVITSLFEGLSNTYLESLASDIKIIAPNSSSGFIEFAYSRPNVFLFDIYDPDSLLAVFYEALTSGYYPSTFNNDHYKFIFSRLSCINRHFFKAVGH